MWKTLRRAAAAFAFGAVAWTAPASATPVTVTNVQLPYYETITLWGGIYGAGSANEWSGQIVLTTNLGTLYTWCVDITHVIYLGGNYVYTPGPLVTDNRGSTPANSVPLTAQQISKIEKLAAYGNGVMAATPSNAFSAALQAAIWNLEYGTTSTGSAQFTVALANIMSLLPTLPSAGGYQLFNQNGSGQYVSQGQFVSQPIPEPAVWCCSVPDLSRLRFFSAAD